MAPMEKAGNKSEVTMAFSEVATPAFYAKKESEKSRL
jgi:hypothetical protein